MIISPAFAQTTSNAMTSGGFFSSQLIPLLIILAVFFFLIIRPQQKKIKSHQQMVSGITKGDKVLTSGGIIGKVVKTSADNEIAEVEIAPNVVVEINKQTLSAVITSTSTKTEATPAVSKSAPNTATKKPVAKAQKNVVAKTSKSPAAKKPAAKAKSKKAAK